MKKITFLLVAIIATVFCACSSDGDDDNTPKRSQFIFSNDSIIVSIGQNYGITIFKNKECVYQNQYRFKMKGDYPVFTYTYTKFGLSDIELELTCSFSNPSTFTAIVECSNIIGLNFSHYRGKIITLPSTMLFKADNAVLDVNHDGLIDE